MIRVRELVVGVGLTACDGPKSDATATAPSPSAPSVAVASVSASAKTEPQRIAMFRGVILLEKKEIALDKGVKVAEWKADDGRTFRGECKAEIELLTDGSARGALSGCDFALRIQGVHDDERVSASLSGDTTSFTGTFIASKKEDQKSQRLMGVMTIANGDATLAREGTFDLARE
jgi:hypothetical protein